MVGMILVPGTKRHVPVSTAVEISAYIHSHRSPSAPSKARLLESAPWFSSHATRLAARRKPLLVGVFQDQLLDDIIDAVETIGLDLVQLHGSEPVEWTQHIPVPVIKVHRPSAPSAASSTSTSTSSTITPTSKPSGILCETARPGYNHFILLDSPKGGSGETFDWTFARDLVDAGELGQSDWPVPVFLAGGLTPENVGTAIEMVRPWVVDVSSGVEEGNQKSEEKVRAFIAAARGVRT